MFFDSHTLLAAAIFTSLLFCAKPFEKIEPIVFVFIRGDPQSSFVVLWSGVTDVFHKHPFAPLSPLSRFWCSHVSVLSRCREYCNCCLARVCFKRPITNDPAMGPEPSEVIKGVGVPGRLLDVVRWTIHRLLLRIVTFPHDDFHVQNFLIKRGSCFLQCYCFGGVL